MPTLRIGGIEGRSMGRVWVWLPSSRPYLHKSAGLLDPCPVGCSGGVVRLGPPLCGDHYLSTPEQNLDCHATGSVSPSDGPPAVISKDSKGSNFEYCRTLNLSHSQSTRRHSNRLQSLYPIAIDENAEDPVEVLQVQPHVHVEDLGGPSVAASISSTHACRPTRKATRGNQINSQNQGLGKGNKASKAMHSPVMAPRRGSETSASSSSQPGSSNNVC